jgi:hypothetical protein
MQGTQVNFQPIEEHFLHNETVERVYSDRYIDILSPLQLHKQASPVLKK